MKKVTAFLLLALLGCATLVPSFASEVSDGEEVIDDEEDEYEDVELDENRAVLIAHKFIKEDAVIQGRNMTVQIVLHNVGKGVATNIKVTDSPLDQSLYKLAHGSPEASFTKINPGSSAEHSYVVIPQRGDMKFFGESAVVKFSALIEGPATQELLSTTAHAYVLTKMQSLQVHLLKLGRVLSLGMLKTPDEWFNSVAVIIVSGVLFGINSMVRWYMVSKGERTRAKARAELGDH